MKKRTSGILLPIYALPSKYGCGSLGKEFYNFIEWLKLSKQSVWEVLPIHPTAEDHNPYYPLSMFAGNPLFIDLDLLCEERLITEEEINSVSYGSDPENIDYDTLLNGRDVILHLAYLRGKDDINFLIFKRSNAAWLTDYVNYVAIRSYFGNKPWYEWPDEGLKKHDTLTIEKYSSYFEEDVDYQSFLQYKFYQQWEKAKAYANAKGIKLIGEINAFPATDSADVWANQEQFMLDDNSNPAECFGIPPKKIDGEGEVFPCVTFRWPTMRKRGYEWWMKRIDSYLRLFDLLRIRRFSSFEKYFVVSAYQSEACYGKWTDGPGEDFISTICSWFGTEKFVGLGNEDISFSNALIDKFRLAKKRCMQNAFITLENNPNLPHNLDRNCVYYLEDAEDLPMKAFFDMAPKVETDYAKMYSMAILKENPVFAMIRCALSSPARMVIIPMQDILGLGADAATIKKDPADSFRWCFSPVHLTAGATKMLADYTKLYGR